MDRIHKKTLQDLNQLCIAQNMEEAIHMESMLDLLEMVHAGKEDAAKEIFKLTVEHLKDRQEADTRRASESSKFQADATAQLANCLMCQR